MKKIIIALLTIIMVCGSFIGANAYMINSKNDAALLGGNVINFENVEYQTFNLLTVDNVTFSTLENQIGFISSDYSNDYNATGKCIENINSYPNAFTTLNFTFNGGVNAFGFNFGASNENWILSAYDSGHNLLESYLLPQTWVSNSGDFFGIAANGISYASLTQTTHYYDAGADYILLDNVTTAPVPEPASMLLLGSGLVGLIGLRKKKED